MEAPAVIDLACTSAAEALARSMPPSLMPLPRIPVSAEVWVEERHIRLHGEALYAVHSADGKVLWAVVVQESATLAAGSVHLVALPEIRCESPSGRRA
jgi:hypothetical protein